MNPEQWLSLKWNGGSTMSDRWLNQSKIIQCILEESSWGKNSGGYKNVPAETTTEELQRSFHRINKT